MKKKTKIKDSHQKKMKGLKNKSLTLMSDMENLRVRFLF